MSARTEWPYARPRLGLSACLLGERVRYDGGHKRDEFIADTLARFVDYLPVCPEVAIGLGVPRPTLRLLDDGTGPRALLSEDPPLDVTSRLERFAERQVERLAGIDGFILKSGSPSCAVGDVRVATPGAGRAGRRGPGVFAHVLTRRMPRLPVVDERGLHDPTRRDQFLTRSFVLARWHRLVAGGLGRDELIGFHAAHSHLLMDRSPEALARLDALLIETEAGTAEGLGERYFERFSAALERPPGGEPSAGSLQRLRADLGDRAAGRREGGSAAKTGAAGRGKAAPAEPTALVRRQLRPDWDEGGPGSPWLQPYPEELKMTR